MSCSRGLRLRWLRQDVFVFICASCFGCFVPGIIFTEFDFMFRTRTGTFWLFVLFFPKLVYISDSDWYILVVLCCFYRILFVFFGLGRVLGTSMLLMGNTIVLLLSLLFLYTVSHHASVTIGVVTVIILL